MCVCIMHADSMCQIVELISVRGNRSFSRYYCFCYLLLAVKLYVYVLNYVS